MFYAEYKKVVILLFCFYLQVLYFLDYIHIQCCQNQEQLNLFQIHRIFFHIFHGTHQALSKMSSSVYQYQK